MKTYPQNDGWWRPEMAWEVLYKSYQALCDVPGSIYARLVLLNAMTYVRSVPEYKARRRKKGSSMVEVWPF